ncbi:TPA: hypothetical protein HA278_05675 [Candidatus Woesearchaeota archaeon]|nr:hypothetical protein [Candidatus Woesearchaeota archaeon]
MTKDELRVGRKWFLLTKNILFWILIAAVTFPLNRFTILVIIGLGIGLFVLLHFQKSYWFEIFTYALMIIPTFTMDISTNILIVTSLLFLYGIPLGTLLHDTKRS